MRRAKLPARHKSLFEPALLWAVLTSWVLACASAQAIPFTPASDATVLERLPDSGDRAERRALAADPHNLKLALAMARGDIDRARALGDPRYLGRAQAVLAVWPADAPPDIVLLRAVILQSNHDFPGALVLLDDVLRRNRQEAQAWVTRAAIHLAQAEYAASLADCGQFATMVLGLLPDICTASAMSLNGHAPLALRAVTLSLGANAAEAARHVPVALWGMTLAAETAQRLGDASAESWFERAMALDPADPYLLGAWSDWLLDHGRAREVAGLLAGRTRIDPLLLRLALAEQSTGDPALALHVAELTARFDASRLRGDSVHRREEARFALHLLHQPSRALALARANWQVQREPADARILLEASLAALQPRAADPVISWLHANNVQDQQLTALAARLPAAKS